MQCPNCSSTVPDGAGICPVCGAALSAAPTYCAACGAPMAAGAKFCATCGASAATPAEPVAPVEPSVPAEPGPVYVESAPGFYSPNPAPAYAYADAQTPEPAPTPGATYLRRMAGSPLLLLVTIFSTITLAVTLWSVLSSLLPVFAYLEYMDGKTLLWLFYFCLSSIVPPTCFVVGMWVLFCAARSSRSPLSTGGLTTISVASILAIVMNVLLVILLAITIYDSMVGSYYPSYYYPSNFIPSMMMLVLTLAVLVVVPATLYYIKLFAMSRRSIKTIRQGALPPVPSDYMSFWAFFTGAVALVILLVFIPILQSMMPYSMDLPVAGVLSLLLGGVTNIFIGVLLCVARKQWVRHLVP